MKKKIKLLSFKRKSRTSKKDSEELEREKMSLKTKLLDLNPPSNQSAILTSPDRSLKRFSLELKSTEFLIKNMLSLDPK